MVDKDGINQGGDEGIQVDKSHSGKVGPSFVGGFVPIGNAGMAALSVLKSPDPIDKKVSGKSPNKTDRTEVLMPLETSLSSGNPIEETPKEFAPNDITWCSDFEVNDIRVGMKVCDKFDGRCGFVKKIYHEKSEIVLDIDWFSNNTKTCGIGFDWVESSYKIDLFEKDGVEYTSDYPDDLICGDSMSYFFEHEGKVRHCIINGRYLPGSNMYQGVVTLLGKTEAEEEAENELEYSVDDGGYIVDEHGNDIKKNDFPFIYLNAEIFKKKFKIKKSLIKLFEKYKECNNTSIIDVSQKWLTSPGIYEINGEKSFYDNSKKLKNQKLKNKFILTTLGGIPQIYHDDYSYTDLVKGMRLVNADGLQYFVFSHYDKDNGFALLHPNGQMFYVKPYTSNQLSDDEMIHFKKTYLINGEDKDGLSSKNARFYEAKRVLNLWKYKYPIRCASKMNGRNSNIIIHPEYIDINGIKWELSDFGPDESGKWLLGNDGRYYYYKTEIQSIISDLAQFELPTFDDFLKLTANIPGSGPEQIQNIVELLGFVQNDNETDMSIGIVGVIPGGYHYDYNDPKDSIIKFISSTFDVLDLNSSPQLVRLIRK